MHDKTQTFKLPTNLELDTKSILKEVYNALNEKGYNPRAHIVGYLVSQDPT